MEERFLRENEMAKREINDSTFESEAAYDRPQTKREKKIAAAFDEILAPNKVLAGETPEQAAARIKASK